MLVPRRFHLIHDWACFIVGYLLNGTLLWLIANHTEVDGRSYSSILLLSTYTNLVYLAVYSVVVPVMPVDGGLGAIISVGPLGWMPQPFSFMLVVTWLFLLMFSLCTPCVPFLYRYMVICRRKEYGVGSFVAMLAVPFSLSLCFVPLSFKAGYPWTEEQQQWARDLFFNESSTERGQPYVVSYMTIDAAHSLLVTGYGVTLITINYLLVFICGRRIYQHLKRETTTNLSEKRANELNKQVSRALLLQAMVPMVVETLPAAVIAVGMASGSHVGHFTIYQTAVFAWAPVVNPLIPMWVVSAYRREVSRWMRVICKVNAADTSTVMVVSRHQPQQQQNKR